MPRTLQNIVILMEDHSKPWVISMRAANMCFNRFCISENASFELSGVYFLHRWPTQSRHEYDFEQLRKGKGFNVMNELFFTR